MDKRLRAIDATIKTIKANEPTGFTVGDLLETINDIQAYMEKIVSDGTITDDEKANLIEALSALKDVYGLMYGKDYQEAGSLDGAIAAIRGAGNAIDTSVRKNYIGSHDQTEHTPHSIRDAINSISLSDDTVNKLAGVVRTTRNTLTEIRKFASVEGYQNTVIFGAGFATGVVAGGLIGQPLIGGLTGAAGASAIQKLVRVRGKIKQN